MKHSTVRRSFALLTMAAISGLALAQPAAAARHVVVIVWDGMRPDFARSDVAPNLAALADRGVRFMNNHSMYVTSTEVNGTALATGAFPGVDGIVTNVMYFPEVFAGRPVDTQDPVVIEKHDQLTGGHHVRLKTLPELVRDAGLTTAVATSKQVGFIWDRTQDEQARKGCITLAEGATIPEKAIGGIVAQLGGDMKHFDDHKPGRLSDDTWTARALTEALWKDGVPSLSVLWMAEPDASQHQFGPGSPQALAAIHNADACLGMVEAALKQRGLLDQTDIIVVSDHGFSTISQNFSPVKVAKAGGFDAVEQLPEGHTLAKGQIMVSANGGAVGYYVGGHDKETIAKFSKYLQGTDYAGVIFTSTGEAGTFKLEDAFLNAPEAPDILVSMVWSDERSGNGTPGMVVSEGGRVRGQGMHATLSPFDTHNTLIAAGPHFRKGWQNTLPSANADVNPTVCEILGVKPDPKHTGRVLTEALEGGKAPEGEPQTSTITAHEGAWTQYLTRTTFAGHVYIDQGGRGTSPKDVSGLVAEPHMAPAAK
ncbi:MAG: sulfatase-like hydrolase/transferase [Tepidisphaera sp.]|nr:sulfatase-like hydrolase/transferase [Tepidisphaera sp.]